MSYLITVPISVKGTHIYDDRGILGAVGEQNSIGIRITFDESWDGLTKMLFWFSAYDHDTQVAEQVLTDDDLVEDRTYEIQVPAEAFLYPGTAALTIRGSKTTGNKTILYTTEYGKFQIAPSSNTVQDIEPQTVAASVLEQVTQLVNSATAHDASASASASSASASASAAGTSASNASTYAGNASASASSASGYSSSASASAQRAEQMATGAAANASAAASSETECKRIETAMDTLETQAQQAYSMASSVKATADAGGFKGEKGDKGDTGATGAKGDKGDTGVQIVDDESEIESDSRVVIYDGEDEEYTLVEDIKINGTSIVSDGVGNIPIASATQAGVIKINPNGATGFGISADNVLFLSHAANAHITARSPSTKPITPVDLDFAVKSAMCDGRGADWSEAEQKMARKRIGEDKYELIEEIVLTEDTNTITRTQEPDGTAYNFKSLVCHIVSEASTAQNSLTYRINDTWMGATMTPVATTGKRYSVFKADVIGGRIFAQSNYVGGAAGDSLTTVGARCMNACGLKEAPNGIAKFDTVNCTLPAGTTIKIYGIRA